MRVARSRRCFGIMIPALRLYIILGWWYREGWWRLKFTSRRRARIWEQEALGRPSNTMGHLLWGPLLVEFGHGQPAHDYSPAARKAFIDREMRRIDRREARRETVCRMIDRLLGVAP